MRAPPPPQMFHATRRVGICRSSPSRSDSRRSLSNRGRIRRTTSATMGRSAVLRTGSLISRHCSGFPHKTSTTSEHVRYRRLWPDESNTTPKSLIRRARTPIASPHRFSPTISSVTTYRTASLRADQRSLTTELSPVFPPSGASQITFRQRHAYSFSPRKSFRQAPARGRRAQPATFRVAHHRRSSQASDHVMTRG